MADIGNPDVSTPTTFEELTEWAQGKYFVSVQYGEKFPADSMGSGVAVACIGSSSEDHNAYGAVAVVDQNMVLDVLACLEKAGFDIDGPPAALPLSISEGGDPETFRTGYYEMILMRRPPRNQRLRDRPAKG